MKQLMNIRNWDSLMIRLEVKSERHQTKWLPSM